MLRYQRIAILWLMLCGLLGRELAAAEWVVVLLTDGQQRVGQIDLRTDDEQLWLHSADQSVFVQSAIPWNRIASAVVRGGPLSVDELRAFAERQKAPVPPLIVPPRKRVEEQPPPPSVAWLSFTADLANWTRDPLPDGLRLRISPQTDDERTAAVNGLVTVRLYGRRFNTHERLENASPFGFWTNDGSVREHDPTGRYQRYFEVGRWTRRIRADQFDAWGLTLRLPYQTVDPERDLDVAFDGMVDVSLRVDGQGIHHATLPIELRTFSPYREELQLYRRQRFLPGE